LGLCLVQGLRFVVGTILKAGDVTTRISSAKQTQLAEQAQDILHRVCARGLLGAYQLCVTTDVGHSDVQVCKATNAQKRDIVFCGNCLPECAVLLHGGCIAMRREPDQVANGCLVFGSQPVQQTLCGISFALQVEGVSSRFQSLPFFGVTRCKPTSSMRLPRVAKCLAQSVLVGGTGEASARDQDSNFKMGFRKPPSSEVMTWSSPLPEDLKINKRDILECIYTWEGHIQLRLNSNMLLDFNVERPLDRHASYYPVVDVSGAASMLSFLPSSGSATVGDLSTCIPDETELEDLDVDDMSRQVSVESLLISFSDPLEAEDFSLTRANFGSVKAMRNGFNFQWVVENAAPIAGLAGILVLGAPGKWHESLIPATDEARGKAPSHQNLRSDSCCPGPEQWLCLSRPLMTGQQQQDTSDCCSTKSSSMMGNDQ